MKFFCDSACWRRWDDKGRPAFIHHVSSEEPAQPTPVPLPCGVLGANRRRSLRKKSVLEEAADLILDEDDALIEEPDFD